MEQGGRRRRPRCSTEPVVLPAAGDPLEDGLGEHQVPRPFPGEPIQPGALAGGVDAHLAAEGEPVAAVVQHIQRPLGEQQVPLGVDVAGDPEQHFAGVVGVDVVVHHHDPLAEHHLSGSPDGVHDLLGVAGEGFADGHDHQVMEPPGRRQVHIHHFRKDHAQQGQEDPLGGQAQVGVLLGRAADDGGRVDRVLAVGDGLHVQHRVVVGQGIVAGMVAERAFPPELAGVHPALDDDLGIRRHLQVVADAADHLHPLAPEEAGEHDLREEGRQRRRGRIGQGGVAAEADRHRHALAGRVAVPGPGPVVVQLGVEAEAVLVEHLQAVQAHVPVSVAEPGVAQPQGDEGAAVLRPGGEHRQAGEPGFLAAPDHLLAEALAHGLGHPAPHLGQERELGQLLQEAGAGLGHGLLDQLLDPGGHRVQPGGVLVHAQGHGHAPGAAKDVHGHRHGGALDPVEHQGAAAAGPFGHAVGDGPGFQAGVHLDPDPLQFTAGFQLFQEGLEIPAHGAPQRVVPKIRRRPGGVPWRDPPAA